MINNKKQQIRKNFQIILITIILIALITGCQWKPSGVNSMTGADVLQVSNERIPENWPKGMPTIILPLPGEIDNIMGSGSRVRLFYSGVSREDVVAYVSRMEDNGFKSQYEVYVQDRPGLKESEIKTSGQFEGVLLTKDKYYLRITVDGSGGATYSLEGIPKDALKNNIVWPKNWEAIVPRPEGLNYNESRDIEYSDDVLRTQGFYENPGFTDALKEEHRKVVENYCNRLLAMGYRKVVPPESYQINRTVAASDLFTDGKFVIGISGGDNSNAVSIEAWEYPVAEKPKWPESIPKWVPVYIYGELENSLEGGNRINLTFINSGQDGITKYRGDLNKVGFKVIPDFSSQNNGDRIYMMMDNVEVYASIRQNLVDLSFEIR